jgi:hypothetical protein
MPTFPRNLLTLRFSIRAMLMVVTVGCVTLGWRASRYFENKRVVDSLRHDNFDVSKTFESPQELELSFLSNVDVPQIAISRSMTGPRYLATIWKDLSRLTPLRSFSLYGIDLPEQAWASEAFRLGSVTEADFVECRFSEAAFQIAMEGAPQLKKLAVRSCKMEATDLLYLSTLKELESLELFQLTIPAGTMSKISLDRLHTLKLVTVSASAAFTLSDDDLKAIAQMEDLKELHVIGSPSLSFLALEQFKKCRKLRTLCLEVNHLDALALDKTKRDLSASLPNCKIDLSLYDEPIPR